MNIGNGSKVKPDHLPLLKKKWICLGPQKRLYQCPIPIIALTGGIASGKSTVAQLFQDKGINVINADQLIKSIYTQKDSLDFIQKEFPSVVKEKKIDFSQLRKKVFSNEHDRIKLEYFLYQKMPEKFLNEIPTEAQFIVYDIPLLFEKKLNSLVDLKILIYTPYPIQLKRLIKRDNITSQLAEKMLASQWPIEDKKSRVDFVIHNTTNRKDLQNHFEKTFQEIFKNNCPRKN